MKRVVWICAIVIMLPSLIWAEGVVVGVNCPLTWKASLSPNLKEYHVYVSRTRGAYDKTKPVTIIAVPTTQSTCQAMNLTADGQYYLVMTAVALSGAESGNSNEVPFVRDTTVPEAPGGVVVGP